MHVHQIFYADGILRYLFSSNLLIYLKYILKSSPIDTAGVSWFKLIACGVISYLL